MGKRSNGEGTICQLGDGRWQARLTIGRKPDGKPIRPIVYGKTKKEALAKLDDLRRNHEKGLPPPPADVKFGDWLKTWLENYVKINTRLTTYENYSLMAEKHIINEVGHIRISKLQPSDLQRLYRQKLDKGRTDGKGGLSGRTVCLIHLICHAALGQALKENLVQRNVATLVTPPRKGKKEVVPMSEDQIRRFLEATQRERMFAAFFLLLATGIRRGELLGLKWSDIDLDAGTMQIRRSLVKTASQKAQLAETKTAKSRRMIPLLPGAVAELRRHMDRQNVEKAKLGDAYLDTGLVFCREDGASIYPDVLTKKLQSLLNDAGLPAFRVHDLRHTFATMMLAQGVSPKIVQDMLGHSTITMTMDTYSHVMPGMKEGAILQLAPVLRPAAATPTPPMLTASAGA